jgi:hypothetical protein
MFTHSIATPSRLPRSARFGISGRIYPPRLRTRLRSVGPKGLSSLTVFVDASPGLVFVGHRSLPERTITKSPNGYWRKPRLFHIRCLNFNTSPNSLSRFVPSIPSGRAISLLDLPSTNISRTSISRTVNASLSGVRVRPTRLAARSTNMEITRRE